MRNESFRTLIRRELQDIRAAATRYGGPDGADGRGLPEGTNFHFAFATGIECSYPTIAGPDGRTLRRDLLEECGHYARWREDLSLVRELGLKVLRYGLPYHLTHLGPGRYDWEFAD